ncbi:MAG TPA: ChpI protein [Treponema sp.]|nr:ChpI protein [Treponema sp.]
MKTAISLSDSLFYVAEQTASYMGIPRSKLFSLALEEYIARHNGELITQKLNEVYEKINLDEFAGDRNTGLESLRSLTKNDSW